MAALDRDYFNSIRLEPYKNRFYDVSSVDNILIDIRRKAAEMQRELEQAKADAETFKASSAEYRMKGKALGQEVISLREKLKAAEDALAGTEKAKPAEDKYDAAAEDSSENETEENEEVKSARAEAEEIIAQANRERDAIIAAAQRQQDYAIKKAEALYSSMKEMHTEAIDRLNAQWQQFLCDFSEYDEAAPADLSRKIGFIAKEIREIEGEEQLSKTE